MKSFIRSAVTTRLSIFTEKQLVIQDVIIDPMIRESTIATFAEVGWWGFLKNYVVVMVRPEDIANSGIERVKPKKEYVVETFTNMSNFHQNPNRKSFEVWLKPKGE